MVVHCSFIRRPRPTLVTVKDCIFQVEHTFKSYPTGVRYIKVMHGGIDENFWQGHFGTKMAATSVVLTKRAATCVMV